MDIITMSYLQFVKKTLKKIQKPQIQNHIVGDRKHNFHALKTFLPHFSEYVTLPNGLNLEFGVFDGISSHLLAPSVDKLYGFDSFEGFPKNDPGRLDFPTCAFDRGGILPEVPENVTLIKGWFNETLPKFLEEHPSEEIRFLHIDCDLYQSTKCVFDLLVDRIVPGTVILFDELIHYDGFENHEIKAFYEFLQKRPDLDFEVLCTPGKCLSWEEYQKTPLRRGRKIFKKFRLAGYHQDVVIRMVQTS